jgi:hypothetical protein
VLGGLILLALKIKMTKGLWTRIWNKNKRSLLPNIITKSSNSNMYIASSLFMLHAVQ